MSVVSHPYPQLQGMIFDLDGTLVDSGLDFAAIRDELDCPAGVGVLEYIASLSEARQQWAQRVLQQHEQQGAERATLIAGADQVLAGLAERGLPVAIVTRNAREVANQVLSRLGLQVDMLVAREDCLPKPAPDGLLQVAAHWQQACAQLLYVGDFLFDLQAARRAGMPGCLFDPQGNSPYRAQADWVVASLPELLTGL